MTTTPDIVSQFDIEEQFRTVEKEVGDDTGLWVAQSDYHNTQVSKGLNAAARESRHALSIVGVL